MCYCDSSRSRVRWLNVVISVRCCVRVLDASLLLCLPCPNYVLCVLYIVIMLHILFTPCHLTLRFLSFVHVSDSLKVYGFITCLTVTLLGFTSVFIGERIG